MRMVEVTCSHKYREEKWMSTKIGIG